MSSFNDDPREREIIRNMLPLEVKAVIDETEARVSEKIDESIMDFQVSIKQKLETFSELDFSVQMQQEIDTACDSISQNLTHNLTNVKSTLRELQSAIIALDNNDQFSHVSATLANTSEELSNALNEAHTKLNNLGSSASKAGVSVVKKALTGIL